MNATECDPQTKLLTNFIHNFVYKSLPLLKTIYLQQISWGGTTWSKDMNIVATFATVLSATDFCWISSIWTDDCVALTLRRWGQLTRRYGLTEIVTLQRRQLWKPFALSLHWFALSFLNDRKFFRLVLENTWLWYIEIFLVFQDFFRIISDLVLSARKKSLYVISDSLVFKTGFSLVYSYEELFF